VRVDGIDFEAVHPKEVAHHMTLVSLDLLKAIAPDEFVFYIWGKKSNPMTARLTQNLQRLIDRFNKVCCPSFFFLLSSFFFLNAFSFLSFFFLFLLSFFLFSFLDWTLGGH
jgi:hypothetical protein